MSHVTTRHFYELFPGKERFLAAVRNAAVTGASSGMGKEPSRLLSR